MRDEHEWDHLVGEVCAGAAVLLLLVPTALVLLGGILALAFLEFVGDLLRLGADRLHPRTAEERAWDEHHEVWDRVQEKHESWVRDAERRQLDAYERWLDEQKH